MRILIAADVFPPAVIGGAEISTYLLAEEYQRMGHEVLVFTTSQERRNGKVWKEQLKKIEKLVVFSRYPTRFRSYVSLFNPSVLRLFKHVIKKQSFDVIHFNNIHQYISYYAIVFARQNGIPCVITLRDCMSFDYGQYDGGINLQDRHERSAIRYRVRPLQQWRERSFRYNPFRNFFIRHYLRHADRRIAISHDLQRALIANGILDVQVIYNGINLRDFNCNEKKVKDIRKQHNLEGRKVLFWCGRMTPKKGILQALDCLSVVAKNEPRVVLLIATRLGTESDRFKKEAHRRGLAEHVRFTSWVGGKDLVAAYQACDVVIYPSVYLDAFGRVNLEAMACGKPVVSTCFGGSPEINQDGVTGFIINPFNTKQFANYILKILGDPDMARCMGEAGRNRVEAYFRSEYIAKQYIELFMELLQQNKNKSL